MNTDALMRAAKGMLPLLLVLVLLVACGGPAAQEPAADDAPATEEEPAATEENAAEGSDPEADVEVIRMGYLPVIIQAPLYIGIERGYFADEGIEFELETIGSGNDAVIQLVAGNFDVAMGGANAGLYNAAERGLDFRIVAPMHSESPPVATPLIISANRTDEIQSVADLEGKTVAVHAYGAAIEYWMLKALEQGGLTFDDVELQAVLFPNMPGALESGSIDAAVLTEPLVTISQDNGLVSVLTDDFVDGFTASYVYMSSAWLDQNPDTARRFLRAYMRACRDLQGDYMDEETAAIIEKYTEVPAAVVLRSTPAQFSADGTIPLADLEALQAFYLERGHLEYSEPLDVSTFVHTDLVEEVVHELDEESQGS